VRLDSLALAGGAIGKVIDGDLIEILIDRKALAGTVNLLGNALAEEPCTDQGSLLLAARQPPPDLRPHPMLPEDTRLWAALVHASGGVWGGCVYDVDKIIARLEDRP